MRAHRLNQTVALALLASLSIACERSANSFGNGDSGGSTAEANAGPSTSSGGQPSSTTQAMSTTDTTGSSQATTASGGASSTGNGESTMGAGGAASEGSGGATSGGSGGGAAGGTGGGSSTGGTGGGSASVDCNPAEGDVPDLGLETVVSGLNEPVFATAAPGDSERLFVVEQGGMVLVVQGGSATTFLDISSQVSRTDNERGMFALAFHPSYESNGLFYLHYSASADTHDLPNGTTVLSEFSVSDDANLADPDSERVVLTEPQPNWNHNGGMIAFGPNDGFLYLGLGDGGGGGDPQGNGQNQDTLLGSILRLDIDARDAGDYGIPSGNMPGGAPEIWDIGLRNPWRFSFDPCNGDLYIGDVGQNDYEEINVEPAGTGSRNYGWNITEGLSCYSANMCETGGLVEPVIDYGRGEGQSVTGGYVYRGSAIPALRGTYFYADYQSNTVWAFEYSEGSAQNNRVIEFDRSIQGATGGIASFGQDNAGELYIVLRNGGELVKIVPR